MNRRPEQIAAFLMMLSLLLPVQAGDRRIVKRLKFAVGTTSAVVRGTITADQQIIWQVGARKGQWMRVKLVGKARHNDVVLAAITGPDGEPLLSGMDTGWSGRLPGSGDYAIAIGLVESKSGSYTLEVIIE